MSELGSSTQSARYRVLETLGQGGMGVVYRVHDSGEERVIAQKRLVEREDTQRAHALASFRREYHTLAQLAHPNIIEVYDFGIDELGPFYTMELFRRRRSARARAAGVARRLSDPA